jgi:hypothetical protein
MDSLITAAARALAMGDPLGALNRVALRDDAPALALRGIAMAQLGDLNRAKGPSLLSILTDDRKFGEPIGIIEKCGSHNPPTFTINWIRWKQLNHLKLLFTSLAIHSITANCGAYARVAGDVRRRAIGFALGFYPGTGDWSCRMQQRSSPI